MRIMLIVNEFPPEKIAGTAMATQALAEHLSEHGHEVCVLVTTDCPKNKYHDIKEHDYDLKWLKPRPFRGLGYVWRIIQSFKQALNFQPDIIQGQAVSCGLLAGILGKFIGVPSICYAQGYDVYQASWWQRKTEVRWGCSLPTACLAVTDDLKQSIKKIANITIQRMPHAFDLPKLDEERMDIRQRYQLSHTSKLVFNVARLEAFKGHDVLLHAWKTCVNQHPDAQLWIAGTGSLSKDLNAMVGALGLDKHVRFLGFLAQKDIHDLMEAADLFVLPSRSEPFGIVLLEAMAHKLPIVASRVGGIPEVLPKDGITWQVPVNDSEALTDAMLEAMQDGNYPAQQNQVHAFEFTWEKQVKRFESLYEKLT